MSDELLHAMLCAYESAPADIDGEDIAAMRAALAVVREHDGAALTAERERADKYEKAAAHFNRVMLERGVDIENLTAERDELREQVARLVGALEWHE